MSFLFAFYFFAVLVFWSVTKSRPVQYSLQKEEGEEVEYSVRESWLHSVSSGFSSIHFNSTQSTVHSLIVSSSSSRHTMITIDDHLHDQLQLSACVFFFLLLCRDRVHVLSHSHTFSCTAAASLSGRAHPIIITDQLVVSKDPCDHHHHPR